MKMNNQRMIKKSMAVMLAVMMLFSIVGSTMAQENSFASGGNTPPASPQALGPSDPAEMETFLDALFVKQLEAYHIAGAGVSVVKDGKLFFTKGYGYADLEKGIPVDPEKTIFSIGSVGKTFTWTAVMQLVEQGKLDLEADVNTYLDFRIPDTYPEPIRLKHLLNHTSGFEDRLTGGGVTDANDLVSARESMISLMSARVRPPGEYLSYANYNAMLAGYIVARVSGQPYDQYIQEHIFTPLGMLHSTVQSPMPPDLSAHASRGYTYAGGTLQVLPGYIAQPAGLPAGMHQASVTDMARFMIAHLQGGRYSDSDIPEARILKETTMEQMHTTSYTSDPHLSGFAHGWFDWSDNGQQALGHSGYLPPMHGLLLLLPDQDLGIYVVYNSDSGGALTNQHTGFQRAFFDHYYPAPAVKPIQPPEDFAERAGRFVGTYLGSQGSSTTIDKIFQIFNEVKVSDPKDGTLLILNQRFVEVEPLYFRQVDGPLSIVFREDDRGRIAHMFSDFAPFQAYEKLDWYETRSFGLVLALGSVLIFLSIILAGLIRLIRDRRRNGEQRPAPRGAGVAHRILLAISVLNLLFLAGAILGISGFASNPLMELPLILKIALGLGVLAAVLTAGALVYTVLAWKNRYWGIGTRLYYTLGTVAALAFVWFLNYWNLLGWRY
jgi:CubicO group peptidase (beta-lactamase class C family)